MKAQRKIAERDVERYRKNYLTEQDGIALPFADAFDRPARLGDHLYRRLVAGSFGCGVTQKKQEQVRLKDYDRSWVEWDSPDDLPIE